MNPKFFDCPGCGQSVEAKADYLARGLRCPHCQTGFMPEFIREKKKPFQISPALAFPLVASIVILAVCCLAGNPGASILLMPLTLVYFIPTLLAQGKRNFTAIALLNLFLGWSLVGWVAALVWAVTKDPEKA